MQAPQFHANAYVWLSLTCHHDCQWKLWCSKHFFLSQNYPCHLVEISLKERQQLNETNFYCQCNIWSYYYCKFAVNPISARDKFVMWLFDEKVVIAEAGVTEKCKCQKHHRQPNITYQIRFTQSRLQGIKNLIATELSTQWQWAENVGENEKTRRNQIFHSQGKMILIRKVQKLDFENSYLPRFS